MNLKNLIVILLLLLGISCASSPKSDTHLLQNIILQSLHYRRPDHIGAKFGAERLETNFASDPKPDSTLDCKPLASLFLEINMSAVRQCLISVNEGEKFKEISFKLKREITPFLELVESEDTPACFKKVLKVLPIPREIYFQAWDAGRLDCFNSRIPIAAEEFLGISNYLNRTQFKLSFPLHSLPEGDQETLLFLSTWVMALFIDNNSFIPSKMVTSSLCSTCFQGKGLFRETDPLPPFWP